MMYHGLLFTGIKGIIPFKKFGNTPMKNRLLTGFVLSLLLTSVSCKNSDSETTSENTSTATETKTLETSSPQEVLTKHLDAYFQGDFKTSYAYISDKDKTKTWT